MRHCVLSQGETCEYDQSALRRALRGLRRIGLTSSPVENASQFAELEIREVNALRFD
jgi:hypothetical protein